MSELTYSTYRMFWQPAIRAMVTQPGADLIRTLNPLRLSYTAFADSNPLMKGVGQLAAELKATRRPASPNNRFLQLQKQIADQIVAALDAYRDARDWMEEEVSLRSTVHPRSRECSASISASRSASVLQLHLRSRLPERYGQPLADCQRKDGSGSCPRSCGRSS
jgi:Protein of unknown function (DUF3141)